jgi:5-methylcytosine-specific restriction endonuclease McrA
MIKLEKLEEPAILRDNVAVWTEEYLTAKRDATLTDTIRYRYRQPAMKTAIRDETSEKCAYCESKITHTYPGDVEHILPTSEFPELVCSWSNLTLACGECNRRKSNYYSREEPLINPYDDEPKDHLFAAGTLIFGKPGNDKGALAELKLELNRAQLLERRHERINALNNLANRYANLAEGQLKKLLRNELGKEIENDKEYVLVSKAFLKVCCDIS